tara:strand:+ start:6478 stop:9225 length:2748 start_codon:yes stop_codon:yes gene_type:complete
MAEIKIELRKFDASSSKEVIGELDVTSSEDFPLSLTMQNFDIRDINSRSGSFSKTFDIPANNNNNRILKNIFHQGYDDSSTNVFTKIDSVIYVDNVPIISGKLRVTKATRSDNPLSYSCEFVGDNMDWASEIKNLELKDLRFSSISDVAEQGYVYDNCFEINSSSPSDNTNASNTDVNHIGNDFHHFSSNFDRILWPLMSVGEGLSDRNQVTFGDFVPAFYIKNIWDKIFEGQGYTVESTFCNSAYFQSLIMPFEFEKRAEQINNKFGKISLTSIDPPQTTALNAYFDGGSTSTTPAFLIGNGTVNDRNGAFSYASGSNSGVKARYLFGGNELIDDYDEPSSQSTGNVQMGTSSNNSTITNSYSGTMVCINEAGDHEIDFNIKARFVRDSSTGGNNYHLAFRAKVELWEVTDDDDNAAGLYQTAAFVHNGTGSEHANFKLKWYQQQSYTADAPQDIVRTWSPSSPISVSGVGNKYLIALSVTPLYPSSFDGDSVTFQFETDSFLQISGKADMTVGEPIDKPHFFLPDGKQSDFVMGIAQMYNLQFHTDPIQKKVFVEPYDFFYESKLKAFDWSDKIDYSKNTVEDFPHELKSEIRVKYKDASSDAFLERFNNRNLIDWGEYKEINTTGVFQDGTYTIENRFFNPTFNWYEPEYIDSDVGHSKSRAPLIPIYHRDYSYLMAERFADRADKNFQIGNRILLAAPIYTGGSLTQYDSALTGVATVFSYNDTSQLEPSNAAAFKFTRANFITFDNIGEPDSGSRFRLEYSMGAYNTPKAFNVPLSTHIMVDPNLSFNDVVYYHDDGDEFDDGFTASTNPTKTHRIRGLFYHFYNRMFKQLKSRPKIRVSYFKLSYQDILRMDFRRLVYLDGVYYRINKIVDYKPHLQESTKVELMEFFDLGKDDVLDGDVMNLVNGLNI